MCITHPFFPRGSSTSHNQVIDEEAYVKISGEWEIVSCGRLWRRDRPLRFEQGVFQVMGRGDARQTFTRIPAPSAQMDARATPDPLSTRDDVDFPRLAGLAWPWQQHMGGQGRPVERCASSSVSKRERRHPHLGGVCNAFVEPRERPVRRGGLVSSRLVSSQKTGTVCRSPRYRFEERARRRWRVLQYGHNNKYVRTRVAARSYSTPTHTAAARSRAVEGSRGYFSRVMGRQLRRCRADVIHAKGWRQRRRRFSPMTWSVVRLRRATAKGPARSSADGGPP